MAGKLGPGPQASYVRGGKIDFNGIAGGFRAFCDWDSASVLEVIFVSNLQTGAPDLLRSAIPRLAAGEKVAPSQPPELATTPVADEALRRCQGSFQLGNGTKLVIRAREGVLWANDWVLLPTSDGGFFSPRDYGKVRAVAGQDGTIERLDWEQRGESLPGAARAELTPPVAEPRAKLRLCSPRRGGGCRSGGPRVADPPRQPEQIGAHPIAERHIAHDHAACGERGSRITSSISRTAPAGTRAARSRSSQVSRGAVAKRWASQATTSARCNTRSGLRAQRGSSARDGSPSAAHTRRHCSSLPTASTNGASWAAKV